MLIKLLIKCSYTILVLLMAGCAQLVYETGLKECAPVYGNWCGENYPLEGNNPRPVDAWDRACRAHDRCYGAGKDKANCDHVFLRKLERLSYQQPAPMTMHNAHSWFEEDGQVNGWFNFMDETWSLGAQCEGGDGKRAIFVCAINSYQGCPYYAVGRAGMQCRCGFYSGVIVENKQ